MKFLPWAFVCLFIPLLLLVGCGGLGNYAIYTAGTFSGEVVKDYYDEMKEDKKEKKDD